MTFKRMLVAVNSPTGRDAAFERGLALAKSSGAELYLLHAVPVNQPFSFRGAERLERMADLRKRRRARANGGTARRRRRHHRTPCERA
jgi:nucleotide-binding universal stress UspA family protein